MELPDNEDDWIVYLQQKAAELKNPPRGAPTKRNRPKVTRHKSPRQRVAESMTKNLFRAGTMSAESAEAQWSRIKDMDGEGTREVGPGDLYNRTLGYSTGKDTGYRGVTG